MMPPYSPLNNESSRRVYGAPFARSSPKSVRTRKAAFKWIFLLLVTGSFLYLLLPKERTVTHEGGSAALVLNPHIQYVPVSNSNVCERPKFETSPLVSYGLMIDAGSTGSRIHVYRFNYCNSSSPDLEHEIFEQVKPGLSAWANNLTRAALSLKPLLDIALQAVPSNLHHCTPIQVKATAGLRLLGSGQSQAILDEVTMILQREYPFRLVASESPVAGNAAVNGSLNPVAIMDGADEGVYAWMTVNSLLPATRDGAATATIMDLGGASTQIVFQPHLKTLFPEQYRATMSFAGKSHLLYQHSYLGYGLKEAIKMIRAYVVAHADTGAPTHPCYQTTFSATVAVPANNTPKEATYHRSAMIRGHLDASKCAQVVKNALFSDADPSVCKEPPCSFAGVHHPSIPQESGIYVFSYFYDYLSPVLRSLHAQNAVLKGSLDSGSASKKTSTDQIKISTTDKVAIDGSAAPSVATPLVTTLSELAELQILACSNLELQESSPSSTLALQSARQLMADMLQEDPDYCAGITYMTALLRGYRLESTRQVTVMKKIRGYEMGWCLGATMSMLDASERINGVCSPRS